MNITLLDTKATKLQFEENPNFETDNFEFSCSNGFSEEQSDKFIVKFQLVVESTKNYKLELEFCAEFQADDIIDSTFKESHFPKVNAPAIAYPYMRSFVSTLILNAGFDPVILPTVNFQALAQNQLKK